jgi:hypothetical protein
MTSERPAQEWVEVEWVVLTADERADGLPADTARLPYTARARGLTRDARLGATATITTVTGRQLQGTVVDLRPGYDHTFGRPLPAWIAMRDAVRESATARRSADSGTEPA